MKAKQFLTENSYWFDKSPGGENLYFESEVIRMMNDYANEALRKNDVRRGEQLRAFKEFLQSEYHLPISNRMVDEFEHKQRS